MTCADRGPRLGLGLLLLATALVGCADELPTAPHPVILVDIDTLGAKHLGVYGYERQTSPNLDTFARQAVRFEWAFSQAPNTPPSQTSILTGLYPSTHGMIEDHHRVPQRATTLAEALRARGFRTAAFVDGGYMAAAFGHDQGFELYHDLDGGGVAAIGPPALRWIDQHLAEPFFLLLHTYDVHWPYDPPEPHRSAFLAGLDPPTPGFEPSGEVLEALRRNRGALPPNDLEYARALYDGGVRYVDAWFGDLLGQLGRRGLLERATIVVLSDHGEELQEHGSVGHDRLYATVTRIPLLIRLPGGALTATIGATVESIDLMPTILELTGTPAIPALQGRSLVPLLRGSPRWASLAISESPFLGGSRAITIGDHRLLLATSPGSIELFRYRVDPDEQHDLSAQLPEVVERLRRGIEGWQRAVAGTQIGESGDAELDAATLESLRALGYVD